jgi:hypothetical protein
LPQHRVALESQLAVVEERHAVGLGILLELLKVLGGDGYSEVGWALARHHGRACIRGVDEPLAAARDVELELAADGLNFIGVLGELGREILVEHLLDVDRRVMILPSGVAQGTFFSLVEWPPLSTSIRHYHIIIVLF